MDIAPAWTRGGDAGPWNAAAGDTFAHVFRAGYVHRDLYVSPALFDQAGAAQGLGETIDALSQSTMFREALGDEFVNHFVSMKRYEIGRFQSHVTDWEHREYFEAF
jgi:glutamine synthetase